MSTTIKVANTISLGHRLPQYAGICSSPHGHNVKFEVEIEVQERQFVDFKAVSDALGKYLEPMDHAMVLFNLDPLLQTLFDMGFRVHQINEDPTTEALARHIYRNFKMDHPAWHLRSVTVYETDKYSATYSEA